MIKNKKKLISEDMPEVFKSIEGMDKADRIYADWSLLIANRIYWLTQEKGWSQRELAQKLFKKEEEVSRWIKGEWNFTLRTLAKLQAVFGEPIIEITF